ncbi:MAG: YgiT-type zinc finger domain-containing protein [Chloroflexi bacterium]|nr:MAG: YgiT-type zinc finger domain-containing protein [Chloroflexota bacterium]HDN80389.1 YgiT-type zinc finger protein [Chloroflexota bacterium]
MSKNIVSICPVCGGEVVIKKVEKLIRRGRDVLIVQVEAGVCTKCGEHIYDLETQELFQRLRQGESLFPAFHLHRIGYAYEVIPG